MTNQYAAGPPAPTPIEKVTRTPPTEYSAAVKRDVSRVSCHKIKSKPTKTSSKALEELPLSVQGLLVAERGLSRLSEGCQLGVAAASIRTACRERGWETLEGRPLRSHWHSPFALMKATSLNGIISAQHSLDTRNATTFVWPWVGSTHRTERYDQNEFGSDARLEATVDHGLPLGRLTRSLSSSSRELLSTSNSDCPGLIGFAPEEEEGPASV